MEESWCEHALAGRAGAERTDLALSSLHANLRFFGVHNRYSDVDRALVSAIGPHGLDADTLDLGAFARAVPGACALKASDRHLGPARVERLGSVAWVHPGTGDVSVAEDARAVVIDLRDLPQPTAADEWMALRSALDHAAAPALARPVDRPQVRIRHHQGMADECLSDRSMYFADVVEHEDVKIPAGAKRDLALAVVTESRMPNEAALLAGALRMAGRAWIYGADVLAAAAESRWSPVGSQGLVWRYEDLLHNHERWPDRIPADSPATTPDVVAADLLAKAGDPSAVTGAAQRGWLDPVRTAFGDEQARDYSLGSLQAALLSAHGTARLFFGYLGMTVQPAELDSALHAALAESSEGREVDGPIFKDSLRRFGVVLKQQHNRVAGSTGAPRPGIVPVYFEGIDGIPVVRRSREPSLRPGDSIVSVDGVPIADFLRAEATRTSAATEGSRLHNEMQHLVHRTAPTKLGVRDTHGATRDVLVTPQPPDAKDTVIAEPSGRGAGSLADLGAQALYYINLDGTVLTSHEQAVAALREARSARGLVLDMRGYPGPASNEVEARVMPSPFAHPQWWIPELFGPDDRHLFILDAGGKVPNLEDPSYGGPIVLLVGPATVSWAEDIALNLVEAHRVTVVGQTSAGDDGNVTCLELPGGFGFWFTGMAVKHADGSPFEGIGIKPDVPVRLRASDFAAGRDPELLAAIEALRRHPSAPAPLAKRQ